MLLLPCQKSRELHDPHADISLKSDPVEAATVHANTAATCRDVLMLADLQVQLNNVSFGKAVRDVSSPGFSLGHLLYAKYRVDSSRTQVENFQSSCL